MPSNYDPCEPTVDETQILWRVYEIVFKFLEISKSVVLQIQNLFDEGPLSVNSDASLDALENLATRMDEVCDTFVVILNSES